MPNNLLNIVFAGTSDFAAKILNSLLCSPNYNKLFTLSAVYTQPDRESGRGRKIAPSPVKQVILDYNSANQHNIRIEQPVNFKNNADISQLQSYQPDLMIVVAYGLILPQSVLDIPKLECVNIHASLLPRWRGAAPIQRAILAGDVQTGITIQKMEQKLDTGPSILQASCNILDGDTTITLSEKLCDIAISLTNDLVTNYKTLLSNKNYQKQDESLANYAHKLDKAEAEINWQDSAVNIHRKVRALNPWPSVTAIGTLPDSQDTIFKIIDADVISAHSALQPGSVLNENNKHIIVQTADGQLEITKLQFSGGNIITARDALNGKYKSLFTHHNILK